MFCEVTVDSSVPIHTFDRRFASFTHDIQDFIGYNIAPWNFDWTDPTLRTLLTALTPFVVRAGGTWEDGIFWEGGPKTGRPPHVNPGMVPHELTEGSWRPFAHLMTQLPGAELVVGLSALWRDWRGCDVKSTEACPGNVPWDSANAAAFIQADRQAGDKPWGYELGNEPAVWNWTWGTPIVSPRQHAADYAALNRVIATAYADVDVAARPKVLGPDTTWGPLGDEQPGGGRAPVPGKGGPCYDYWNGTLQAAPELDVATFHYYGIQPGIVTGWKDFVTVARDRTVCSAVTAHARDLASSPLAGKVPLWLGEGGMTYGGFGQRDVKGDNWLRLYGGGLSYLENLGCAASNGASVFMRQQLSNFINGTFPGPPPHGPNPSHYRPQPAWWVAVLWKRLVGTGAFSTAVSGGSGAVHAFGFDSNVPGAVATLVVVNWDLDTNSTRRIEVRGCVHSAAVYQLTPAGPIHDGDDDRDDILADSTGIAVNGREAQVGPGGDIPQGTLDPTVVRCEGGRAVLDLAGLTGAFVVI